MCTNKCEICYCYRRRAELGLSVCLLVCLSVGHVRKLCEKRLNRSSGRFGTASSWPKEPLLDGVKVGRIHSPPRGVTRRRCGFSSKSFDHLSSLSSSSSSSFVIIIVLIIKIKQRACSYRRNVSKDVITGPPTHSVGGPD